jgi:hypothetical protein
MHLMNLGVTGGLDINAAGSRESPQTLPDHRRTFRMLFATGIHHLDHGWQLRVIVV